MKNEETLQERLTAPVKISITKERAEEIRQVILWRSGGCLGIGVKCPYAEETEEEKSQIMALWKTMPGYTCYYDAVTRITRGENI